MSKLSYDVGLYEKGKYVAKFKGKITKEYSLWSCMLRRCYSSESHKLHPSYVGCSVSENFKNFQWFAEWCNNQIGFGIKGFQLDKDLLVSGNRVYSENTCVFVPRVLNMFLQSGKTMRGQYPIGVCYNKRVGKFQADLRDGSGNRTYLGYFATQEGAFTAYKTAKELLAKQLALQWMVSVDLRVVEVLNNFTVSISD